MSKLKLAAVLTAAALGVVACRGAEENNVAIDNLEEMNTTDEANMDMGNMDMNMDMNATDNTTENATDNMSGNEAIDANTSY